MTQMLQICGIPSSKVSFCLLRWLWHLHRVQEDFYSDVSDAFFLVFKNLLKHLIFTRNIVKMRHFWREQQTHGTNYKMQKCPCTNTPVYTAHKILCIPNQHPWLKRRMVASRLHLRISYPCHYFYYEMIHHWRKSMEKAVESQSSFKGFFPGIDQWSAKWSPSAQSSRTTVNSVTLWQQCFLKTKEELFSKHEESLVVKPLEQISSWEISGMWCWSSTL